MSTTGPSATPSPIRPPFRWPGTTWRGEGFLRERFVDDVGDLGLKKPYVGRGGRGQGIPPGGTGPHLGAQEYARHIGHADLLREDRWEGGFVTGHLGSFNTGSLESQPVPSEPA